MKDVIPDEDERRRHIFTKQLYGIAITEMTSLLSRRSLYCSKYANTKYSIVPFKEIEGNIRFKNTEHYWEGKRCGFCGASKLQFDRAKSLEQHAYEFTHTQKLEGIFKMRFDVIIGNPPYQLDDEGHGMSAKPIYHLFVEQAKKLSPRYLSMIIPARWFAGGKGLSEFRASMLSDKRLRYLIDYENSRDAFPGVDVAGGICYFLWSRDDEGDCVVVNTREGKEYSTTRDLKEFDIFIRNGEAIPILRKVQQWNKEGWMSSTVSSRKPFGLPTNYQPADKGIPCWFIQRIGLKWARNEDISDINGYLGKWKVLVPPAPIAGQTDFSKPIAFYYESNTRIAAPGECCTESWLVAGAFDSHDEAVSFKSYLYTKTVRFLLLQTVVSQHVTRSNFRFIPALTSYKGEYTDILLRRMWGITDDEWDFIDSRIASE